MAWRTERWLADLFPGADQVYDHYRHLTARELIIVAGSVLDAALAELIHRRFSDFAADSEEFLGVSGNAYAPAATFGSRIQLALLIGILTTNDAQVLRAIKNLRNTFAHRVNATFLTDPAKGQVLALLDRWKYQYQSMFDAGALRADANTLDEVRKYLDTHNEAAEGLILAVFSTYQAYFHMLSQRMTRIQPFA